METIIGIVIVVVIFAGIIFTVIEKNSDNCLQKDNELKMKNDLKQESQIVPEEKECQENSNSTEWIVIIPGLFIAFIIMLPMLRKVQDDIGGITIVVFGAIISVCMCYGLFKLIAWLCGFTKHAIKEASKKVKSGVETGMAKGVDFADKTTQKVANKVVKVIIDAKQNASEPDEKEELKSKIKDLELEILKKKVKELEDKLK